MSNNDVIELGSSDDEREPPPKKSKPMPNAMVCIPRKLHEVTIRPAKPTIIKQKFNAKPAITELKPKVAYNPFSLHNTSSSSSSRPLFTKIIPAKCNVSKGIRILKTPMQGLFPGTINLPSSITVKRNLASRAIVKLNVHNKQCVKSKNKNSNAVFTVELDDDEASSHTSKSPQWYVRPEEQKEDTKFEEHNNKEPDPDKLIEITIEDSPMKPESNRSISKADLECPINSMQSNTESEMVSEYAIVIEDSPVKTLPKKIRTQSGSEKEDDYTTKVDPQSKKKLEYPKETEGNKSIEIEIDLSQVSVSTADSDNNVIDKKESLASIPNNEHIKLDKISKATVVCEDSNEIISMTQNTDSGGFHPIYQSFIDLCFQLENSPDMEKIVEKKVKGYYRQVPKEYTESEQFTDMVSSKILSMKAGPEKMYLYIKDIVDELNLQRKLAKSQPILKESKTDEPTQDYGEASNCDSKRSRQIRRLDKTIKKLHRAIQKLEEQEVDFDDEDDSAYLLTVRYKERMVRVYDKFCQLTNTKMPSEPRIQLDARPGQPLGPAKRLERWINKKVPIGTPLPFPDFHDVLRCVREANDEDKLGYNEADIIEEARDLFVRCGRKLQQRRQENEWRLAASRLNEDIDPAEKNNELQKKLSENKKIAVQKENEVFNKFADRQNQLKLEAEEIGDKEAEESPVESEEEELNEQSVSLESTEKRKESLKRLIKRQSKKSSDVKATTQTPKEIRKSENELTIQSVEIEDAVPEAVPDLKTQTDVSVEGVEQIVVAVETESSNKIETENQMSQKEQEKNDSNYKTNQSKRNDNETAETLTLSDSNELDSDIDELHLLQKLHNSREGQSSTVDTSDSESPTAISDSLESSEDNGKENNDDVISIENSSYSEDEPNDDAMNFESCDEDMLPASSEEENNPKELSNGACVNLKDDLISIDETNFDITDKSDKSAKKNHSEEVFNKTREICSPLKENLEVNDINIHNVNKSNCESNTKSSQKTFDASLSIVDSIDSSEETVQKIDDLIECIESTCDSPKDSLQKNGDIDEISLVNPIELNFDSCRETAQIGEQHL